MKRTGNLYQKIISWDNLYLASKSAQKGKRNNPEIIAWNKNLVTNLWKLQEELSNFTYSVSPYHIFTIKEPKKRIISKLPFRDRVVHHALMRQLYSTIEKSLISQTYSCLKGRGIHKCLNDIRIYLQDRKGTQYALKFDIKKFYPSINNDILKKISRQKFKDNDLLWLLDTIINSCDGLPLGNYTSQHLANMYLNEFDHWIKQTKGIKYYVRYCDDCLILHHDKQFLYNLKYEIITFLRDSRRLELSNYQVFPIVKRPIDMVGYVIDHNNTRLRKSIKSNFKRMLVERPNLMSISSYRGWMKHANCKHLEQKLLLS